MKFDSLLACISYFHCEMNEVLLLHQEALLLKKIGLAKTFLMAFKNIIDQHIALEDEIINPLHQTKVNEPQWKTTLYVAEHGKILQLLKKIAERLDAPPAEPQALNRWVIDLLDYERAFKNVIEHHEEREEKGLLIELADELNKEELQALIERCVTVMAPMHQRINEQVTLLKVDLLD